MERRTLLATLGALGAGGAVTNTGAFTETSVDRQFGVRVSGDAAGYLGLQPSSGPNGAYVNGADDGELEVDLTAGNEKIGNGIAGGEGVNANGFTDIVDAFQIVNQGTQEVEIDVSPLVFVNNEPGDVLLVLVLPLFPAEFTLGVGESQAFSLFAISFESDPIDTSLDRTITITAETT